MGYPGRLFTAVSMLTLMGSLLSACYSGTNPDISPSNSNPAGFYTGTLVSTVSGTAIEVLALASDLGELRILDPVSDAQYVATLSFAGNDLEPSLSAYAAPGASFPDNSRVCAGHIQGTIQPGAAITGRYDCGGDSGSFSLLYDVGDSLQRPAGRFPSLGLRGTIGAGDVLFLALDSDGGLSGSDSAGCTYTGQMTVIDPFINIYSVTLAQTCSGNTATLTGLSTFGFIPQSTQQAVYLGLSDADDSLAGALLYQ